MPTVNIGTTSKRVNSLSKVFSGGSSMNCKLKEPCSMHNPVFKVQGLSKGTFFNYCSFEGRYYWVDDIVYLTNDIQEVHCHLDVLATFADQIKDSYAYVKYGDAGHWNKIIDDERMQPEVETVSVAANSMSFLGWTPTNNGTVVVTVFACNNDAHGVLTYAMDYNAFINMTNDLQTILTGSSSTWVGDVAKDLANVLSQVGGLGSWRENIIKAIYLPIPLSEYSGNSEEIVLGGIATGHYGKLIHASEIVYDSDTVTIPWASETATYPFLKNPRWTCLQLQTPSGYQEIDTTYIKDQTSFGIYSSIDKATGDWALVVRANNIGSGLIIGSAGGNFAFDITGMIGKDTDAFTSFMRKTAGAALMTTGAGFAAKAGMASKAASTVAGNKNLTDDARNTALTAIYQNQQNYSFGSQMTSGIGGTFANTGVSAGCGSGSIGGGRCGFFLGGGSSYNGHLILKSVQLKPNDLANYESYCDRYGYPCNAYLTIGSISGYCECVGGIATALTGATDADQTQINSFLNSGVYVE